MQDIDFEMVTIPAGSISLKDEAANRFWRVSLRPYLISVYAVTQEQYQRVIQGQFAGTDNHKKPVVEVSWFDAVHYCNLLSRTFGLAECYSFNSTGEVECNWEADGYRLPTEAEWEYACRAGSNDVRYGALDEIAWYRDNSGHRLHEVGTKAPNAWGLHDMIGNSWEWCWDVYDAQVYGEYRVFRGGGWYDQAPSCRASCRRKSHPTFHIDDLGFRLVRTLK